MADPKRKPVVPVQDPKKMRRDHISTVGKMVLSTSAREAEPFLTTNQWFAREVGVPVGHGTFVPPNSYRSWCNFNIITGVPQAPPYQMDPELAEKLARVDPHSRSSAWDHPHMLELPRAQQCSQLFLRSHSAFLPSVEHPSASREWRSASKLVESKHRNERSELSYAEKYRLPITAASEMGWGLEMDYKMGRVPPKDFHFGIRGSHITRFQQSMLLGPMSVANSAPPNNSSHSGIIG